MSHQNTQSEKLIDISIIGPAMNESGNLVEYVERCVKAFDLCKVSGEVIIIDDGSTDETSSTLHDLLKQYTGVLRCFRHRRNFGLTQALKTGFSNASGEKIIWISTDLESYPDEDIPIFLEGFNEGADVVVGYRQDRSDGKKLASRIYNFICNKLFGLKLRDMNWTKGFKRECLPFIHLRGDWHRFIVMMFHNAGFTIVEKEMKWHPRKYGQSKFGIMRFPRSFIDAISIWFLLFFSKKPMRLFGAIGAIFIGFGVLIHVFLIALYLVSSTQYRPIFWGALTAELMGLQFILFGFIAELIERVRDEVDTLKLSVGVETAHWEEIKRVTS